MKTLLLFLTTVSLTIAFGFIQSVPAGEKVELSLTSFEVKAFTRTLSNGDKQTFNVVGPNKNVWVDSKGKKLPSSNFSFKKPGVLIIKKATKGDSGVYDYEPLVEPEPADLPPGGHVDQGIPSAVELEVN